MIAAPLSLVGAVQRRMGNVLPGLGVAIFGTPAHVRGVTVIDRADDAEPTALDLDHERVRGPVGVLSRARRRACLSEWHESAARCWKSARQEPAGLSVPAEADCGFVDGPSVAMIAGEPAR